MDQAHPEKLSIYLRPIQGLRQTQDSLGIYLPHPPRKESNRMRCLPYVHKRSIWELRQRDHEFEASVGYTVKSCLRKRKRREKEGRGIRIGKESQSSWKRKRGARRG